MLQGNPQLQSQLNVAAKDKFLLLFELPYILKKRKKELNITADSLEMTVHGTVVPEISIPAIESRFSGQNYYVSSHSRPSYGPLTINFVIDNQYKNYKLLWQWLNVLNNEYLSVYSGSEFPENLPDSIYKGNQTEYQSTLIVKALDEYNSNILEFKYTKAFITKLGGINFSYKDPSLIEGSAEFYFSQLIVGQNNFA